MWSHTDRSTREDEIMFHVEIHHGDYHETLSARTMAELCASNNYLPQDAVTQVSLASRLFAEGKAEHGWVRFTYVPDAPSGVVGLPFIIFPQ